MPVVTIEMWEGRSIDQKKQLAEGITASFEKIGTPFAVSLGVCLFFLYYIVLAFARSLGLSGILPSILSAWLANLVFFFFGVYLMMKVER